MLCVEFCDAALWRTLFAVCDLPNDLEFKALDNPWRRPAASATRVVIMLSVCCDSLDLVHVYILEYIYVHLYIAKKQGTFPFGEILEGLERQSVPRS